MEPLHDLLVEYQLILSMSEKMLVLARQGQWDQLVELETSYLSAVENTTQNTSISQAPLPLQEALYQKLRRVLENETELKNLLQARLDELSELVGQSSRQQALSLAYGQFSAYPAPPDKPS